MTPTDHRAAQRLSALWESKRHVLGIKQVTLAAKYGVSPAIIHHYIRGKQGLNVDWVLIFAKELGVSPMDIYPELFEGKLPEPPPPQQSELIQLFNQCSLEVQESLLALIRAQLHAVIAAFSFGGNASYNSISSRSRSVINKPLFGW